MPRPRGDGALARLVRVLASAAARRPRTTIVLWLLLVVGCVAGGAMAGTNSLTESQSGVGESARADARIAQAGLRDPAVENVLVRSGDAGDTRAAAAALTARVRRLPEVSGLHGPADAPGLATADGRTGLVQVTLRGDPDDAGDRAEAVRRAVTAVGAAHPGVRLQQAGVGSVDKASSVSSGTTCSALSSSRCRSP